MLAGKRIKAFISGLAALFLITTCCGVAFADDIGPVYDAGDHSDGGGGHDIEVPRIVQGPTMLTADGYEVCVYAFDPYTAAFMACGYDYEDYELLSADAKALLSNADTGGAFYEFAQSMSQPTPYLVTNLLYGADNVWYGRYTYELQRDARQAIQDAIDGNVSGGGGNTQVGNYIVVTAKTLSKKYQYYGSDTVYVYDSINMDSYNSMTKQDFTNLMGSEIPIYIKQDNYNTIIQATQTKTNLKSEYYDLLYFWNNYIDTEVNGIKGHVICTVNSYPHDGYTVSQQANGDDKYILNDGQYVSSGQQSSLWLVPAMVDGVLVFIDITSGTFNAVPTGYKYTNYNYTYNMLRFRFSDGQSTDMPEPTIPPTNWPDEQQPTTPTQPSVPDAPTNEPTTQPSEPSMPTVEPYPDIVYQPDTTYTQADLSAVLDALNEHCRHLQTAIHNGFSSFWSKIDALLTNLSSTFNRFLAQQLKWVVDSFNDSMDNLMTYLKSLFEWLAEQFDFTFTGDGYDDNTVVSWLIKIYSRLGAGINLRPADPVADPDGIGDWLTKLFTNLINLLLSLGSGIIDAIGEPLQQLTHKFPFSVPWDLAALLGMLVADPVVPVITMPSYSLGAGGLSHVADYVIDLTPYDAYVGGIRLMIKLAFIVYLIANAGKYMDMLDKVVSTDA